MTRAPSRLPDTAAGRSPSPATKDACAQAAAVLACLPSMTPARLRAIFDRWPDPLDALHAVATGKARRALEAANLARLGDERAELSRRWKAGASDPAAVLRLLDERGTHVWWAGHAAYPIDEPLPDRPAVLLAEGACPGVLGRPSVAIVGTRAATPHGLADARMLGAYLAGNGVTVVSGLAIGIDGAAHQGALDGGGGVVAVVATGLDVVYPRRHLALDARVRAAGLVVSETGFGVGPEAGRFPVRNRIIAALADVVVVVEATSRGGARITADRANDYGRPVLAIPGSRRNASATGCNELIADGAYPLLDPGDVMLALGLGTADAAGWSDLTATAREPDPRARSVLDACGGEPATLDELSERSGLTPTDVAGALRGLERDGLLRRSAGRYWPA
ncbi:MAG: protecting protein DprA [Actinomycetia bacterium]|nr:protecting protein DprA [Actinomycetes bacterium]